MPQIEVTFDIDANGIVHVSAKDQATGNEQSMTITGQSSLDNAVIDQMVKDAESHAEEDRQRKEQVETRNNADNLVYQTEKLLSDQGEELTGDEKTNVEEKLSALKETLEGEDTAAIASATEALMTASQEFGQRLYEAAAAQQNSSERPSDESDSDVVDAEIVDEQ